MQFPDVKQPNGMSNFLKFKPGDFVTGVFRGSLFVFYQHWAKGDERSTVCSGEGCELCAKKKSPSMKFRLNFVTKDESGQFVAKIFEQGFSVFNQLKTLNTDYPLEKSIVKITRMGSGTDTRYTIMPMPKHEVTPALEAQLAQVKLNDCEKFGDDDNASGGSSDAPSWTTDSDIPF